jgi:hypothetical protein
MWSWLSRSRPKMPREVIVVSGLPRSGTSMMMQMLDAGGCQVLVDDLRKADEDNPKGYYEFDKVKRVKDDSSFLEAAGGTAVKIISMLLYDLPQDQPYKIIFMRRDLDEILRSQKIMLRRGENDIQDNDADMRRLFDKHLNDIVSWLADRKNYDTIYVSYKDLIENTLSSVHEVNHFLGNCLDVEKMAAVVDAGLYRNRGSHP